MQPRKLLFPLRDTVFHVTNSGCSSFRPHRLRPSEKIEERELAGVSTPDPLRCPLSVDEVVDLVDGRLLFELAALVALTLSLRKS